MSIPEFGVALGIYTVEFIGFDNFLRLHHHIHHSPSCYCTDLTASQIRYDASHSKETSLSLALRYIQTLLAHILTGRKKSSGVVSTTEACYLWSMATEDITNDIPPPHKDPHLPPPLLSHRRPTATLTNLSEQLTYFEQQCFARFDSIEATLQQICQHFHISPPPPPRDTDASDDEDL
ncbi:hypothetical protein PVK06_012072 [Gossypium arboreum]|uniref:Uncharacterized protein n=1 Tax=Gossypium arboreum TaxID=29729 RepID=A0ABR0QAR0_GOSAR|nr:hypothetical protein PVK06_012072 [Gossypium arboreum]